MIAAAQFHPPVVKNQVSTLFQGIRSTSLIEFPFSFYFDKSRKPSQRWVVSMRTKAEIAFWLGFWCSEMLISDIQKRPRQRLLHRKNRWSFSTFTELDFSAWQGCTGYRANLNVSTNIKKVDNHCSASYQGSLLADMLSFTFVLFSVCDSRQLPLAFVSNSSDLLPAYWSSSRCRSLHTAAKFTDSETFQLTTRAFLRFNFSLYWWDFFKLKTELFGV